MRLKQAGTHAAHALRVSAYITSTSSAGYEVSRQESRAAAAAVGVHTRHTRAAGPCVYNNQSAAHGMMLAGRTGGLQRLQQAGAHATHALRVPASNNCI
jgi:hypothetical protein